MLWIQFESLSIVEVRFLKVIGLKVPYGQVEGSLKIREFPETLFTPTDAGLYTWLALNYSNIVHGLNVLGEVL